MNGPTIGLHVYAAGEVRDADGKLLSTSEVDAAGVTLEMDGKTYTANPDGTVDLPVAALAAHSDDQLRAAGLDEPTIAHIRSIT